MRAVRTEGPKAGGSPRPASARPLHRHRRQPPACTRGPPPCSPGCGGAVVRARLGLPPGREGRTGLGSVGAAAGCSAPGEGACASCGHSWEQLLRCLAHSLSCRTLLLLLLLPGTEHPHGPTQGIPPQGTPAARPACPRQPTRGGGGGAPCRGGCGARCGGAAGPVTRCWRWLAPWDTGGSGVRAGPCLPLPFASVPSSDAATSCLVTLLLLLLLLLLFLLPAAQR